MNPCSRMHTLVAGAALILLTNAVALGGVAWNRAGIDSTLTLSQRELRRPYLSADRDASGVMLALQWRVRSKTDDYAAFGYGRGGAPEWLDDAKMQRLGFAPAANDAADGWRSARESSREVLLVLELAGPSHDAVVEAMRRASADAAARLAADPDNKELQNRAKQLNERSGQEERDASRLFVVDAGLDRAELRAAYPDRSRHAIVRGQVAPWRGPKEDRAKGYVRDLSIDTIAMPSALRARLAPGVWNVPDAYSTDSPPFEATVAFGRRLEPWITEVANGVR